MTSPPSTPSPGPGKSHGSRKSDGSNSSDGASNANAADSSSRLSFVRLFTDGACRGNPGPGGWACILRHPASGKETELSGGDRETTNNRMELQAVIEGLRKLTRKTRVEVVTDSKYVADGSRSWRHNWKKNGWKRKQGKTLKPVSNVELWQTLDQLLDAHDVSFTVVKGHSGHPENERCDELAVAAAETYR